MFELTVMTGLQDVLVIIDSTYLHILWVDCAQIHDMVLNSSWICTRCLGNWFKLHRWQVYDYRNVVIKHEARESLFTGLDYWTHPKWCKMPHLAFSVQDRSQSC